MEGEEKSSGGVCEICQVQSSAWSSGVVLQFRSKGKDSLTNLTLIDEGRLGKGPTYRSQESTVPIMSRPSSFASRTAGTFSSNQTYLAAEK